MCAMCATGGPGGQNKGLIPWSWSYRQLVSHSTWILGTQVRSSEGIVYLLQLLPCSLKLSLSLPGAHQEE